MLYVVQKICYAKHALWLGKRDFFFPIHVQSSTQAFELVEMDIWGPSSIPTINKHHYFLPMVDDFTKFTQIFYNQFDVSIKVIRSDNGSKLNLIDFYSSRALFIACSIQGSSTKQNSGKKVSTLVNCSFTFSSFSIFKILRRICSCDCSSYKWDSQFNSK